MLDLRRVEALMEVARRESFSAAADALNYTQSAVSQQIAALERQTDIRLLNRNPIALTEAGRALCARAEQAIAHLRAAEAELEYIKGLRDGSLRLGSFASAGAELMPAAIREFRRLYPGVAVTLAQHEVVESEALVRSGALDLALTFDDSLAPKPLDPLLTRMLLIREQVYVAMAPDHPLARAETMSLADLNEEPWISAPHAGLDLELLAETAGAPGFEPQVTFEGDDFETVLGLVAAGLGVAMIPQLALGGRSAVVVRPIAEGPLVRSIYATTLITNYPPPSVKAMQTVLEATVRRLARRAIPNLVTPPAADG